MNNPWQNISPEFLVAECDRQAINALPEKKREKMELCAFPEPFAGSIDSPVVCLNLNPGQADTSIELNGRFKDETLKTLSLNAESLFWLEDNLTDGKGVTPTGAIWWKSLTAKLSEALGHAPRMFVLEYFPYHSPSGFSFPKLPSDSYRNFLLKKAMDEGKLIVIMRSVRKWFGIQDDDLGKRLEAYQNKIILKNPQRPFFSPGNMNEGDWKHLVEVLKQK